MAKQTSTLPQYQYKKKHGFFYNLKKYRILTLMCVPAIVFFFAFNYMPLPGIYVAFVKYNYRDGIFGSKFVGLKNFEFLMQSGKLLEEHDSLQLGFHLLRKHHCDVNGSFVKRDPQ